MTAIDRWVTAGQMAVGAGLFFFAAFGLFLLAIAFTSRDEGDTPTIRFAFVFVGAAFVVGSGLIGFAAWSRP